MTSHGIPGIVFVHGIRRTRQEVNADLLTFIQN